MTLKKLLIVILGFVFFQAQGQEGAIAKYAKAKKGEGLYSFLKRNALDTDELIAQFIELNKSKLGKDKTLLLGVEYKIPATEVFLFEPLFGKERERFRLESNILKGAVFYLVSGHGGPDPGALGKYGHRTLAEDEYAYDITLRLAKKLQENGARIHMIIQDENDGIRDASYLELDSDETCMGQTIPLDQTKRLKQRTEMVNELYLKNKGAFQRCLVVHVDSRSKGNAIDVFFYHAPKSKNGKIAAGAILNVFDLKYSQHQPSRGYSGVVSARNLYLLRKTYPVTVFVELGNIRNFRDQQRFILENNRQALANWLYEGLLSDYKNNTLK
ncbi:N-acetylmuramoyl-L-alanine amidase [Saccharicrinis carchari]|uniref:N-acetylmuramoyl-L-alanine amidase n=1 Tax=Saccharicrinis carchari TaxID=1168039 RepID=A0A521BIR2_SACCC|nr:N-acetylmuramoyl-L-alanine amidase [Saccharicrinis carchari]SMO46570.1 N-acetylmuramoyl-L-alanine amidase [Saccharicrinis carchari]